MQLKPHLIHSQKQYWKIVKLVDMLSENIRSSEKRPLLDIFELTCDYIRTYDLEQFETPDASPQ
jgi:hypothetical protein